MAPAARISPSHDEKSDPGCRDLVCLAVLPVRPLKEAKSRLAGLLSARERRALVRWMLERVLRALLEATAVDRVLVVSRDAEVLEAVRSAGALTLLERGEGLNGALAAARRRAAQWGADSLLVIPADLPLLAPDDVDALVGAAEDGAAVVAAPCPVDGGTNALLLRPPGALPFAFGEGSFERHRSLARKRGLTFATHHSPPLALDIDRAEDLEKLRALGVALPVPFGAGAAR
ncbi:MAG: 2-phospho-L-lactate guanylyltransferase [Nitrospinota bacterium]